ncbi:alpha-glucoside ABC transporter substrate-binding protein [Paractinoplanes abujensis]|uniref:Alpha-glucoside transport system substrate-binding protein n=1 Tax=Paractinoplanes abujensis TaxID=882441 RepID=A0A7W7CPG6_9ACTN|nr:ABC transporter substrate-binding protein [Actinoplanes abujensis]MBB4690890.1 alpha-glucoside transport system substrate-binding protein [Actinoplanes abujensis]GID17698.1 alpha-glucoside ABC transporter substrate-binding protein [Actinoplanes abujensis]
MFGQPTSPRFRAALAGTLSAGLVFGLAACGGGDSDSGSDTDASAAAIDCAPYTKFGDIKGKTVTIYTGIVTPEDTPHIESYKPFEQCTGATIKYEGDKSFETQVLVRARAGNPPDLAIVPQPGLVKQLVSTGKAVAAPQEVSDNVDKFWDKAWKGYTTIDGKFYGAPLGASVKSLVWYSPSEFKDKGYTVPTTLDELKALSDKIVADGGKPWCAGIASGDATGWPVTDWVEDMVLRTSSPETYDKWVSHEIPFNAPEISTAFDAVGGYLKNDAYVNGGLGDVKSIATTTFQDAGLKILEGQCSLHRQASFYAANFEKGTKVAEDGDVFAFYLPGKDANTKPVLGAGEFVVAFADRPEVKAFQTYLSSDVWANTKAKLSSGWVTANKGLDQANLTNPIDKLAGGILLDPNATFRFDGSDMMPAAVGSDAFWKQSTAWITGQDTKTTVDNIEKAWPK